MKHIQVRGQGGQGGVAVGAPVGPKQHKHGFGRVAPGGGGQGGAQVQGNRHGGGGQGVIGIRAVLGAPADGHTLLMIGVSTGASAPHMIKDLPYDPLRDLVPIGVSLLHALVVLPMAAWENYESASYLVQPGVDPMLEARATASLERGLEALDRRDYDNAEVSLRAALTTWQRLTKRPPVPLTYHTQLGCTLNNLGYLALARGRTDEAETYFTTCLSMADTVAGGGPDDAEFRRILEYARTSLEQAREDSATDSLADKDRDAVRKYEIGRAHV